jgi:L-asparaginase / beta-aspartyl-peptidase
MTTKEVLPIAMLIPKDSMIKYHYTFFLLAFSFAMQAQPFGLVIHGGAGSITEDRLGENAVHYQKALEDATIFGYGMLEDGADAVQVVAAVIAILEDNPLFNAGKGAVANSKGEIFHDASIMEGRERNAGAVASIFGPKNPIYGALAVMNKSPHVMLSDRGAEDFCRNEGLYFLNEIERKAYIDAAPGPIVDKKKGTVGCVVLDRNGLLAAGTSTGGMSNKTPGRIGDSPIIGAGTWADNRTCAVSATGHGEYFIRSAAAYAVSAAMLFMDMDIYTAMQLSIQEIAAIGGTGGLIGIDREGNIAWEFNTKGMFRAGKTNTMSKVKVEMYGE